MDRERFNPIPNPYVVGNPIEDRRMFFGRQDDFAFIKAKVAGGKKGGMIVLCGTRRSGKTSILFQIKNGRLGTEFVPVLIDMQAMMVQSDREFLDRMAAAIVAVVGSHEVSFERDYQQRAPENPFDAFHELTEKVERALHGRKLVLMFDEYELFETHIDKGRFSMDVLHVLANWMETRGGVFIIFTGSDRLEARKPRYWGYFLGKALHRRISFLSKPDTMRLVNEPLDGIVRYEEGVPEEIYALTAGQPFYTQVICQAIVDHLNEMELYDVTRDDIRQVVEEIIDNPLPQMIFTWSSLTGMEKLILSIMAELNKQAVREVTYHDIITYPEAERIGYRLDPNTLRESIERLFVHDLLAKDSMGERYCFKMDLWRQWTLRMHSIWQVIDEIKGGAEGPGEGVLPVETRRIAPWLVWTATPLVIAVIAVFAYRVIFHSGSETSQPAAAPDSASVSIITDPAGARIFLDRMLLGPAPMVGHAVSAGRKVLEVELAGYHLYTDTLILEKDDAAEVVVALKKSVGSIAIDSSPRGAAIILDENDTGLTTPAVIRDLSVTELHDVRLQLGGYSTGLYHGVRVIEDSTTAIQHKFSRVTYPLTVLTTPPDAELSLDGSIVGTTPMNIAALTGGIHIVTLRLSGYKPVERAVGIPAPNNMIEITLEILPPGRIVFQVQPFAELWIDGELVAEDVQYREVEIAAGAHRIELRHPHFGTVEETVSVESGETVTKEYRMEERARK